jgi:hypothetical protein
MTEWEWRNLSRKILVPFGAADFEVGCATVPCFRRLSPQVGSDQLGGLGSGFYRLSPLASLRCRASLPFGR